MSDRLPFDLPPVDASAAAVPASSLSPELLAGLLADGDDELVAWTLRHAIAEDGRAAAYDGLLREAMALVGERWVTGQWTIAEEHLASRTIIRALERLRPEAGPEGRIGPLAVLAGVAGEHHMIALACFEQLLAEDGWAVANLGADLPAPDLGRYVARNDVAFVAISAHDAALLPTVAEAVRAVREATAGRRVDVIVGGALAAHPGIVEALGVDGAARSLAEAVALAAAHRPDGARA